jgi:DNA-binding PadR family transcriptional regulator
MSNKDRLWIIRPLTGIETGCLMSLALNNSNSYDIAYSINCDIYMKITTSPQSVTQALKRMAEIGMVSAVGEMTNRRVGRNYCITPFGETQLETEIERLADIVVSGRDRLAMRREAEERQLELSELKLGAYGL